MRRILVALGKLIIRIVDFLYPPFSKYFSRQFFRYGITGASNVFLDWILYFITYNFILRKQIIDLPFLQISISAHIAALLITFPITLLSGFLLQKYVTFTASNIRGYKQFIRYISVVIVNLLINYFGLKLLVEVYKFYPTISKMIVTIICTIFSYFSQKHFTFKSPSRN